MRSGLIKIRLRLIRQKVLLPKFNPRAAKNAVVTGAVVTGKPGKPGGATYAQILSKAKQSISLASLGIQNLRMRRAMNSALIMELPGPDRNLLDHYVTAWKRLSRMML